MARPVQTVRDFCLRILERGDLSSKLDPPGPDTTQAELRDDSPGRALDIREPAREPGLAFSSKPGPLPLPRELGDPAARAQCLARFAHHELMAVELFAWALLRWPELSPRLRRGWLGVLGDEQRHCRLYLERLTANGSDLASQRLSNYFWQHVPAISTSEAGPRAFVAAMGLTLEQANLDFTGVYRDAFRAAGDEASAGVCQRVHEDEIGHVHRATQWLGELSPDHLDDVAAYRSAVPFPFSAARAKGKRFDILARRRAGLSEAFISYVRSARSSQESGRKP